ncbi:MAG: nitronate monooxygenase [Planctomycetaceae bacterium]|nr:nitronate monooxygenase [Planctomycetaceae bacterium]
MTSSKALSDLFGIEIPIVQAPMAGVQDHALAVAVCDAGGLGSLPGAMFGPEALRRELRALTTKTRRPYNVNFFCHAAPAPDSGRESAWRAVLSRYYEELGIDPATIPATATRAPFSREAADVLAEFQPPIVSFHFGLPAADLLAKVRSWGTLILSSATTLAEARWLEDHGVDAVIAQGLEAGGHRGHFLSDTLDDQVDTATLVRQIVGQVRLPVLAAGGIGDADGVARALAQGAAGVQVGTAYLLCPEATTSQVHRNALKGPEAGNTEITTLFSGRPARGLWNRLMRELGPRNPAAPAFPLAAAALAPLRARAEALGRADFSPLWSGRNPAGCRELPARTLTLELGSAL